jgi:WD40 repeat protein
MNSPTPRPTPRPTPKATPTTEPNPCPPIRATTPAASNPNLALVTLSNGCLVVRDITDINHAKSVGSLEGWVNFPPQFVSATAISYMDTRGLLRTPLSGSPRTLVAGRSAYFFAWSPDGKTAAYLTSGFGTKMQLHLVSAGKDRLVSSMPGLPAVFGCESQACGDGWDFHLSYSPDGRFITWAQNITDVFRMWTASGVDVTPKTPSIQKTIWSGSGFYFQDSKGIEVWRSGAISTFMPGVSWIRPKASPGGGQIVYETRDSAGVARTYVVDTATAKVRGLGTWRAEPAFLTSRFIWDQGERSCKANECVSGSAIGTGHTYIYDLLTGTETESVITSVLDVWPHPA